MTDQPAPDFAGLLRELRMEARLTQEELAEAAELSTRTVSDLERGVNRRAQKDTARLLADALGLTGPARARSRGPRGAAPCRAELELAPGCGGDADAAPRHRLVHRAPARAAGSGGCGVAAPGGVVGIHAIGGMAGVGKTAFAVHAAHQLAPRFPAGQIFLPLHGHTPGQRPVDPGEALASLLLTAGVAAGQIPPGLEARMALWRDRLAGQAAAAGAR